MTYHERELFISRTSPLQHAYLQKRTYNTPNYSTRLLPPQSLRVECKTEERHFITDIPPYTINSSLKPIRFTMSKQLQPVQFRSEIIVHNNPETDVHIKRLRVAFHYLDDPPTDDKLHSYSTTNRTHSLHIPKRQEFKDKNSKRKTQSSLHQWIDDICTNKQLMDSDDIVFLLKMENFLREFNRKTNVHRRNISICEEKNEYLHQ